MTAGSVVAILVALCTGTGCTTPMMLVVDVQIDGNDVVIEKCPLHRSRLHIGIYPCRRERQPMFRTIAPDSRAATHSVGPTGFASVARAVNKCGTQHRLDGVITVTLVIETGRLTRVDPNRGGEAFAACLRTMLDGLSFDGREGTMSVPFKIVTTRAETTPKQIR